MRRVSREQAPIWIGPTHALLAQTPESCCLLFRFQFFLGSYWRWGSSAPLGHSRRANKLLAARVAAALGICCIVNEGWGAIKYTFIDLGVNSATDINNRGQVIGSNDVSSFFLYSGGVRTAVNTPGLSQPIAYHINNHGDVVGNGYVLPDQTSVAAFSIIGGVFTNLGSFGGSGAYGQGINDSGQMVVAKNDGATGAVTAYIYSVGTFTVVPTPQGATQVDGSSMNSSGQVAGGVSSGIYNAAILTANSVTMLGSLNPGSFSFATSMNDAGQAVGYGTTAAGTSHAFLYSNGVMHDLGGFFNDKSQATDINNLGVIVGNGTGFSNKSFVYSNGTYTDLSTVVVPPTGTVFRSATAINDLWANRGAIAASTAYRTPISSHRLTKSGGTIQRAARVATAANWNPATAAPLSTRRHFGAGGTYAVNLSGTNSANSVLVTQSDSVTLNMNGGGLSLVFEADGGHSANKSASLTISNGTVVTSSNVTLGSQLNSIGIVNLNTGGNFSHRAMFLSAATAVKVR